MSQHRAIVETGPGAIRRLCCAAGLATDDEISEVVGAALSGIGDRVVLVGERPVAVDSLWRAALRAAICVPSGGADVVHPSWWSSARVGVVTAAAGAVTGDVQAHPRSRVLTHASGAERQAAAVEISERLVVITGAWVDAIPRGSDADHIAEKAARSIEEMAAAVVVIDAPSTVTGAPALARSIAGAVRKNGHAVVQVDDARLARLARSALSPRAEPCAERPARSRAVRSRGRPLTAVGAAALVAAAAAPVVLTTGRHGAPPPQPVQIAATTFLVEGRVALTVPANWPAQRVLAGPGSARVQVTSPSDPEVALHVTQSPVRGETLGDTAERLKHAIDSEAAGVFIDFDPAGSSAGRPAVTYREVRPGHQVRWTVLLDGPVRISIGCQSRPGNEDAIRAVCEQAVRTAHAIG